MEVFGTGQLETTWSAADPVRFNAGGEFDSAYAPDLDFDLTAVTLIDSTGLELLLQQRIDERRERLRLYPNLDIRRLLEPRPGARDAGVRTS
jgi:hypothetical protein